MRYEVAPLVGIGPLHFDMEREIVRATVDLTFSESAKEALSPQMPTDFFNEVLFVYYGLNNQVRAFEVCRDIRDSHRIDLMLYGMDLFSSSGKEILNIFMQYDSNVITMSEGYRSDKLGISVWNSSYNKDLNKTPESIYFYKKWGL